MTADDNDSAAVLAARTMDAAAQVLRRFTTSSITPEDATAVTGSVRSALDAIDRTIRVLAKSDVPGFPAGFLDMVAEHAGVAHEMLAAPPSADDPGLAALADNVNFPGGRFRPSAPAGGAAPGAKAARVAESVRPSFTPKGTS
jgi:hypothetical protein